MSSKRIVLALLILLAAIACAKGQEIRFTPLRSDKIPTDEVSSIVQDKEGFIWIVTYRGLVRYDGSQTVRYPIGESSATGSADRQFHRISCTDDIIYIATNKGMMVLDKETGVAESMKDDVTNGAKISCLTTDGQGRLWAGSDKGLFRKDKDRFIPVELMIAGERHVTDITDIFIDSKDNLWLTSWQRGLFRYDIGEGRLYAHTSGEFSCANALHFDSKGNLWIGTWGMGLLQIKAEDVYDENPSYIVYRHDTRRSDSLLDDIIYDIEEGPDRSIWIGSRTGLSILENRNGTFRDSFTNKIPGLTSEDLPHNEVNSILRTKDNSMWLGMFGGGICKADIPSVEYRTAGLDKFRKAYRTGSVKSICLNADGSIWTGIAGHGFIHYSLASGNYTSYLDTLDFKDFPRTPTVNTMMRKGSGIWFGTYNGGVWILDETSGKTKVINTKTDEDMPGDCITALGTGTDGRVWVCTNGGAAIIDSNFRFRCPGSNSACLPYRVNDISFSKDGNAWLATDSDGIILVDNASGTSARCAVVQETVHSFNSILCDSKGRIWAGSLTSGLYLYDESDKIFRKTESLVFLDGKQINNIEEDPYGHIWVTTNSMVVSIGYDDGAFSIYNFCDISDSYESNSFSSNAAAYLADTDEIAFGCSKGLYIFPCKAPVAGSGGGRIAFTDLKVNNISYMDIAPDELNRRNLPVRDIDRSEAFVLAHDQNDLTIRFSLLDFKNPFQDIYYYRLRPENESEGEWKIINGASNAAEFYGLRPGRYVFEVFGKKSGKSGISPVRSLDINVLRNPLLEWYSILGYIVLLVGAMAIVFGFVRIRYRMKRRIEIAQLNKMKADEVNQARMQFFTNVSHEFMTPLSIILASVESLEPKNEKEKNISKVMAANALRLTRLVQQILEFRKAETDHLKLKVSEGDAARFVGKCIDAFIPLVRKRSLSITYECAQESIRGWFDSDKLDKIVYNLISNAVKYTPENDTIRVTAGMQDGRLRLTCANHGNLMSQKVISGLFKRFYEGDYRKFNSIGNGIGLSLVKSLVTLHKGTIDVTSSEQTGNMFIVMIPLAKECYKEDEIDETTVSPAAPPLALQIDDNLVRSDKTVLFVDDSKDLCEVSSLILSKSFNTITCNSAEEALNILKTRPVDVVVTDIAMPGMDGLQLCSYIKEHMEYSHIPVVLLTAKKEEIYSVEGYRTGADGYLTKPCNFYVLTAMIDNLIRKQIKKSTDFRKQLVFEVKDIDYTSMDKKFLQKAIDVVNEHIDDAEFSQSDFTDAMAMSRTVLTEKLKSLTGFTPTSFVINARLTLAYNLIQKEGRGIRVTELAYSVGFSDPKYFSKRFKAKYGMTPKEMMK